MRRGGAVDAGKTEPNQGVRVMRNGEAVAIVRVIGWRWEDGGEFGVDGSKFNDGEGRGRTITVTARLDKGVEDPSGRPPPARDASPEAAACREARKR